MGFKVQTMHRKPYFYQKHTKVLSKNNNNKRLLLLSISAEKKLYRVGESISSSVQLYSSNIRRKVVYGLTFIFILLVFNPKRRQIKRETRTLQPSNHQNSQQQQSQLTQIFDFLTIQIYKISSPIK